MFESIASNEVFRAHIFGAKATEKGRVAPFASVISASSYLLQNAHCTSRAATYACVCLLIFQIIVEDATAHKRLCSSENKCMVRLCRQKLPMTPLVSGARIPMTAVLDVIVGGLRHNLQLRLDVELYE